MKNKKYLILLICVVIILAIVFGAVIVFSNSGDDTTKDKIKEEKINGDKATVEVEVEVKDYSKVLSSKEVPDDIKDEEGNYTDEAYYNYQLNEMEKVEDKVKYTVTFYLTKKDKEWQIDDLNESTLQKIHGIYIY